MTTTPSDARVACIVAYYETLQPASLQNLDRVYADNARFKDPFNDVRGVHAIRGIFEHMFANVAAPRFTVLEAVTEGDQCFLTWDFNGTAQGRALRIHGASHLRLGADGRVTEHRDYWDAAEELYEKLPLLGSLMRWLRARAAA